MTRYLLPCLVVTCFIWAHGHCADVPKEDHTKSPHTEALDVVFATQQKIIAAVDTENWWHDVNISFNAGKSKGGSSWPIQGDAAINAA